MLMRLQRRIGLAPADGLGVRRRAFVLAAIAWGPIALWWAWRGGPPGGTGAMASMDAYEVTVRLVLAVPLMIVAEGLALGNALRLAPHCADVGVYHGEPGVLRAIADDLIRMRDRMHPWVVAIGVALGLAIGARDVLSAAGQGASGWVDADGAPAFGAAWYLWVGRPIFLACVAVWLWRAVLLGWALRRLSRAGFTPVVTHPDRAGGFGFLERTTAPFGLVAFALTSVVGVVWAREILAHGADVRAYAVQMALTVAIPTAFFLAPMLVLAGPMARAREEALLRYGALVSRHGDALHRRWIGGEQVDDPVLDAPEIGAAADAAALYEAVVRMRPMPVGLATVLSIAVPAALPMLAVLSTQIPLATLVKGIAGALL
ncbi:MAG: hypothetical protein ACK54X_25865 [Burkholderiales bacterium]